MRSSWMFAILFAAVAGALMPVQGATNAWLARRAGLAMTTFWVHGTAVLGTGLVLAFMPALRTPLAHLVRAPWPALLGGVMGVLITWLVAASVPALGMVSATTGILVAQVVTATLLDHFGLFGLDECPLTWAKGFGALLLLVGAWLLLRK